MYEQNLQDLGVKELMELKQELERQLEQVKKELRRRV
jgi:hypothetical protein